MSLATPHPLWTTAGCSQYETFKATIQARMLSGRFRTQKLASHWSDNPEGLCLVPGCTGSVEELEHILFDCKALEPARARLRSSWHQKAFATSFLYQLILTILATPKLEFCHFVLDPSSHPQTIIAEQIHGRRVHTELFYLTRNWCYVMHKERLKAMGLWNCKP